MDGSVSTDDSGRVSAVRFFLSQPEVSLERASALLFEPDTDYDEQDGLLMLSELQRRGALSAAAQDSLRERLRRAPSPFLALHRRACWGAVPPPADHWWWLEPQAWAHSTALGAHA